MGGVAKQIHTCSCGEAHNYSLQMLNSYDPTKTTTLRSAFVKDFKRRFRALMVAIKEAIVDEDCFGYENGQSSQLITQAKIFSSPGKRAFDFPRDSEKVQAFMEWLKQQQKAFLLSKGGMGTAIIDAMQVGKGIEEAWTNTYIYSAYQRGISRARAELVNAGYDVPRISETGGINAAFNTPFHADRAGLLYTRVYSDLVGITEAMDSQISRVLTSSIMEGKGPRDIARNLLNTIKGGKLSTTDSLGRYISAERRALTLARTEVIRAHHAATIQEYRNWKLEGVKVKAEWSTANDGRVCDECMALEGNVYTLNEIEGMIPLHPNCRCVALPLDVTDDKGGK